MFDIFLPPYLDHSQLDDLKTSVYEMQSDRDALETKRALEEAEKNVLAGQLAQQRLKEEELMRQRVRVEQEKYLVQVVQGLHAYLAAQRAFYPTL